MEFPGGGPLSPRTLQRWCCLGHVVLPALQSPVFSVGIRGNLGRVASRLFRTNDPPKEPDTEFRGPWMLGCKLHLRVLEIASSHFGSSTSCRVFSCHCAQFERLVIEHCPSIASAVFFFFFTQALIHPKDGSRKRNRCCLFLVFFSSLPWPVCWGLKWANFYKTSWWGESPKRTEKKFFREESGKCAISITELSFNIALL